MADENFTSEATRPAKRKRQPNGALLKYVMAEVIPRKSEQCIVWPYGKNAQGYGQMRYEGKQNRPHRVVCQLAHGKPPNETMEAAHSCGNRLCVNPAHLSWKTHASNEHDKVKHGTIVRGEASNLAKLTESQAREIKSIANSLPQKLVAEMFGIKRQQVGRIVNGHRWSWID